MSAALMPPDICPNEPVWQLLLDWEGDALRLAVADPRQLLLVLWPDDAWPVQVQWPHALWHALLEALLGAWRQSRPTLRPARLRLVAVRHEVMPPSHTVMAWSMGNGITSVTGLLAMDAGATGRLAEQCRTHAVRPVGDWSDLPMRVRLLVGWTDLDVHDLAHAAAGDVLLMDVCHLGADRQELAFMLSDQLGVRGRRHDGGWLIDQGVHSVMTPPSLPDEMSSEAPAPLDAIPVRITFDLGDRDVTLGELRALMPGYVFNLGRDPQTSVCIRANGRWIGDGELVDIDGRIGVVVQRLQGMEHP